MQAHGIVGHEKHEEAQKEFRSGIEKSHSVFVTFCVFRGQTGSDGSGDPCLAHTGNALYRRFWRCGIMRPMNPLLLIIILILLFGGGGFYVGGPAYGGGGLGLVLLICLIVFLFGGFGGGKKG